ncbi:MAG: PorT family protein [Bacteroidales bacterium]|nr:PorT family protein [Bacteroidales bacterium]
MKKLALLFAILLGTMFSSVAQEGFNVRAGYKIPVDNITENPDIHGFNIGVNKDFKITENFYFRPGLYYLLKWSNYKVNEYYLDAYKLDYPNVNVTKDSRFKCNSNLLEIPLMAAWKKGNFDFEVGPYVSFALASKNTLAGEKISSKYGYKKFDVGFKGSFGYNILEKYYIGISYENGIKNLSCDKHGKSFTQNLSFNLGYNF